MIVANDIYDTLMTQATFHIKNAEEIANQRREVALIHLSIAQSLMRKAVNSLVNNPDNINIIEH